MAKVKLARAFSYGDKYYKAGVVEIPGFEDDAKKTGKTLEEFLPKGATVMSEKAAPLAPAEPAVNTLSELSKVPASSPVKK